MKYVAKEYLVYNRDGRLEAIGFKADTQVVTGAPVPVLDGIRIESLSRAAQCAISRNGTLIYLPGVFEQKSNLVWLDKLYCRGGAAFLHASRTRHALG